MMMGRPIGRVFSIFSGVPGVSEMSNFGVL